MPSYTHSKATAQCTVHTNPNDIGLYIPPQRSPYTNSKAAESRAKVTIRHTPVLRPPYSLPKATEQWTPILTVSRQDAIITCPEAILTCPEAIVTCPEAVVTLRVHSKLSCEQCNPSKGHLTYPEAIVNRLAAILTRLHRSHCKQF